MCTPSIGRSGGPCHRVGTPQMLRTGGPTLRARRDAVVARALGGQERYGPDYLYQVIEVISSGPDLETILRGFVALVGEATECHGCFVYFLQDEKLVLRAASSGYAHLEGRLQLAVDEGLAGWVVRTRHSAYIKDNALEDPRVV